MNKPNFNDNNKFSEPLEPTSHRNDLKNESRTGKTMLEKSKKIFYDGQTSNLSKVPSNKIIN